MDAINKFSTLVVQMQLLCFIEPLSHLGIKDRGVYDIISRHLYNIECDSRLV